MEQKHTKGPLELSVISTVSAEITKQVEKLKDSMPGITTSQIEKITQTVHDSLKIEFDMKFEPCHRSLLRIEKMISTEYVHSSVLNFVQSNL